MQADISHQPNPEKPGAGLKKLHQLPGPAGIPLLGNLLQLNPATLHRSIEKWSDQFGPLFRISLGPTPVLVITAPETIQFVLKNRPAKFRRMSKMDGIMREMGVSGVFNAEGDEWTRQRKLVTQALKLQHLIAFFPVLVTITQKLLNRWNLFAANESAIDIKSELMRYTVDITSRLAFGYNMNTIEKNEDIIQQHLEVMFPALFKRINAPLPYWRYLKLPADKRVERSLQAIRETMQGIIDETREAQERQPELRDHPTNFLQGLLAAAGRDQHISNNDIFGNVLTMLLAGEDTTAHTITWIFYYMHLYPAVQQKMQQEADLVLADKNCLDDYDDMAKLVYMEAVAAEAMRLRPVGPVLFHDALEDVVIDGVEVPKGTGICIHTQYAGLQEAHFTHAGEFMPERWMQGGCPAHKAHDASASIPFGAGPRFCPGHHLAMIEIKAVLAMVCKNYQVTMETDPGNVHEVLAFTLMPSAFHIKLTRRS